MGNVVMYAANRGEGKTKWLLEEASKAVELGLDVYYLGLHKDFLDIKFMWHEMFGTTCPIQMKEELADINWMKACFLTDNLMESLVPAGYWAARVKSSAAKWCITLNKEDFAS